MAPEEMKLIAIIAYAGSDVGRKMLAEYLDDVGRLRRVEAAARDVVNIALNDAGPAAFETMAELRALLSESAARVTDGNSADAKGNDQ